MSEIDKRIGAALKAERKRLKLTQQQVGAAIGVSFQQVVKYESGKNRISGARFIALEKIGISPGVLLAAGRDSVGEKK